MQEGLNSIGPAISDAVFLYVKKKTAIEPDSCAVEPRVFDNCLRELFGCGAEIVEKKILESLYLKLEVQVKISGGFTYAEEVKKAQKLLDSRSRVNQRIRPITS